MRPPVRCVPSPRKRAWGEEERMDLDLSPRERDVLRLLAEFRTNAEIAEALVISVKTAETHVEHILRKPRAP